MRILRSISTEYVECKVQAFNPVTAASIDLTGDSVAMAFVSPGATPAAGDWKTATWTYPGMAGVLVGPGVGGLPLAAGDYDWWMKVVDSPEVPTSLVDTLRII